jgi:hypothetical protein
VQQTRGTRRFARIVYASDSARDRALAARPAGDVGCGRFLLDDNAVSTVGAHRRDSLIPQAEVKQWINALVVQIVVTGGDENVRPLTGSVRPAGFEPAALGLEVPCSIH